MDSIHIDVTGVRQVGIRFDEFPEVLYEDLRAEITALGNELFALVQAKTPAYTGELRSEERLRIFADPSRITGYVDVAAPKGSQDFAKAGALEYGAHASFAVKAHSMRLDHYWSLKLMAAQQVLVEAYARTANIAEVAFERSAIAELQPQVITRLNAVVEKRVAAANA